jgi:DNA-binding XRE family transcriptional regulator
MTVMEADALIRAARAEAGLTQAQLARRLGA